MPGLICKWCRWHKSFCSCKTKGAEPVDEKIWRWIDKVVGKGNILILDAWGSTELGGSGFLSMLFGGNIGDGLEAATVLLPGIDMVLLDDEVYFQVDV